MAKSNSNRDRTKEDRNPFAQSSFAAQCNHASITGKMEIVPLKTLFLRAVAGIILFLIIFGILATIISNATPAPTQQPQGVNWSSRTGAA